MSLKDTIHDAAVHVAARFQKYVYVEWFIAHKTPCYLQKIHLLIFTTSLCSPEDETAISTFFFLTLITSLYSMGMLATFVLKKWCCSYSSGETLSNAFLILPFSLQSALSIFMESWNHLGWKYHFRSLSLAFTVKPTTNHVPGCHIYTSFNCLQGWWINCFVSWAARSSVW